MLRRGTIPKVLEYYGDAYPREVRRALSTFFADVLMLPEEERMISEDDEKYCNEWFLFDFKLQNGKTPIEHFYETNPLRLTGEELAVYKDLTKSLYDVFEVLDVRVGSDMSLRSLSKSTVFLVKEYLATFQAKPGTWVTGRICYVRDHYEIVSGASIILPFSLEKNSERHFKKMFRGINPKMVYNMSRNVDDIAEQNEYGTESFVSLGEARKKLEQAFQKYRIDKFVSVKQVQKWIQTTDIDDEDYRAPTALLMGLAESREFDCREALNELMPALQEFANALPRKTLGGKSPNDMWREREKDHQGEQKDLQAFITHTEEWNTHYRRGMQYMKEPDGAEKSLSEYRKAFQALLNERTTFREVYRLYANTAIALFQNGEAYAGKRMLETALKINPYYDFAADQLRRYEAGEYDQVIAYGFVEKTDRMSKKTSRGYHVSKSKSERVYTKKEHDRILRSVAAALFLQNKEGALPFSERKLAKREEREEKKAFEQEPWHTYTLFLKKFGINFNHQPEVPTRHTFFRADGKKIARNEPCPCGGGKKYKKCHMT